MTCETSFNPNCKDNANHLTLSDRGANGVTAGKDCVFIGQYSMGGIVGSPAKSNRGDVIIIMNEAAHAGKHTTVPSSLQLEHCGNLMDDKAAKLKGRQKIITPEGYAFPLSIINGLPHLKMRRCAQAEFDSLLHIILTSDAHT